MGSPKKSKVEPGCSDRISSLPKEIKECILSNLKVQEAVRASILSSAWRNVWTTMPDILLYDWSFASPVSQTTARSKFITLVDLVLALHKGSLDTFILEANRSFHDVIDRWISMLSQKVPKAITIKFASGPKFKIPSSLFSISDLKNLRVKYCIITLPRKFEGFKRPSYPREEAYARNGAWDQDETAIQKLPLDHLSMVTIYEFRGLDCEVSFVRMLLSWAPALEELKIHRVNDEDDDSEEICMCKSLMRLLALPRVSPKAKVIVT
ncbi:hypothetical protein ACQ4PT_011990 [Festuca glaucescens]